MKHFTDQEIEEAIKKAPKFIQDEISSGEDTAVIIAEIGRKFGLHIDIIGTIAELNRNMLLGFVNPQEVMDELILAKIPDKDARQIMTEINQKIFVPLHEQMRSGGVAMPQNRPQNSMSPTAFPQGRSVPGFSQGNIFRPAQAFRPTVSNTAPIRSASMPLSRPMSGSNFLEDHEEPHIEFNKPPASALMRNSYSVPRVPSDVPKREGNLERTAPPPSNLPGAMPPSGAIPPGGRPSFAMPQMPTTPVPTATLRHAFLPPLVPVQKTSLPPAPKPYSTDPYREPLE